MSCVRLLNKNYTESDKVAARYISSADSSYPEANLYDKYRRRKIWRSAGYYLMVSGSNTIVFREAVGVDLTATVPAGAYTSFTTFAAALKTALEDAGVATYTITRETDQRIKILSSLGGGATVFQLRFATSTAMAAILGYDATNLSGAASYVADEIAIHTEEWIKYDMGIPLNPDSFVFASQRNEFLKFSPSVVIKLQGNETDNWTAPAYNQTLNFDDYVLALHNPDGLHTAPLRYWRVSIVDTKNPNGYVEASLIFIGTSAELTRGCVRFPLGTEAVDSSITTFAEGGNSFTVKRAKSGKFDFIWNVLTKEDVELLQDVFAVFGTDTPFWVIADPNSAFSSAIGRWTKYVKFSNPASDSLSSPNNFDGTQSLREEI